MNFDTDERCASSLSVTGEHLRTSASTTTPPKKTYKYKCIANSSSVDEMLFSSHRDKQVSSSRPGSAKKSTRPGSSQGFKEHHPPRPNSANRQTPPIKSVLSVNSRPQSRSGYRVTASKSFVDESLFGPKLKAPSWLPPWVDEEEERKRGEPLFWGPPGAGSLACTTPEPGGGDARPGSAAASRPGSAAASRPGSAKGRPPTPTKPPPWK